MTRDDVERLTERLEARLREMSSWGFNHLPMDVCMILDEAADALGTAGMYTKAHEALDDMARERVAAAESRIAGLMEVLEGLRAAHEEILCCHDGNQADELNMPDLDYARRTISAMHRVSRQALSLGGGGDNQYSLASVAQNDPPTPSRSGTGSGS